MRISARRFPRGMGAMICSMGILISAGPVVSQGDIAAGVQQARERFKPVTPDQLAKAKAELVQRVNELERYLRPSSPNGARWFRYLKWDALKQAIAADGPQQLEVLDETLRRLHRNENGLELPQFRRLADALQRYRNLVAVSLWENPSELYGRQLEALQNDLDAYRQDATPANEAALGRRLAVIDDLGQAPELVAAIRRDYARPNAFIDISTDLVAAGAEPINRNERITDNILGTNIHGDAHTVGTVDVASIPSDDKAILQFRSRGRSTSRNVGYNGPAVIHSTGNTNFTAIKRVELSDPAFASMPARATARTNSNIHSIAKRGGGIGSRIVSNQGWQRANQKHGQADSIASDHAEDRIERQFNRELNDKLADARARYEREYRKPLVRRGELPKHIRFKSDEEAVSIETTQAGGPRLAASGDPPAAPEGHDVTMRLHESAVNNYTASMLGGATASETQPGGDPKFDVKVPDWMDRAWQERKTESDSSAADAESFKPWSMRFRERPISVDFEDGKVKLTTHVDRLKSGDQTFEDWDITGTYAAELADGGIVLRREGELEMLPADFSGSLSSRQTAERRNLEKEINQRAAQGGGYPETIEFDAIEPEGPLASAGPLEINEFVSDDGWLVLAWDRQKKPK